MWGTVWVRKRGLQALVYALPVEKGPYEPGMRVLVPLGRYNQPVIGLLVALLDTPPAIPHIKPILQRLDTQPLYDALALAFLDWIVKYYLATPGDVAYLALPGRVGGITDWVARWQAGTGPTALSPKKLYQALREKPEFYVRRTARQLHLPPKQLLKVVRSWARQGHLLLEAVVRQSVRRPPSLIEVAPPYREAAAFQAAWNELPPKEAALFLRILQSNLRGEPLVYAHLLRTEGTSLQHLIKKKLVRRLPARTYYEQLYARPLQPYTLTPSQARAFRALHQALETKPWKPALLHGVTASGKTFIYLELMRHYLRQGHQVLYLLPEIALTKQTLDRLRTTFGEAMALYHSGLTESERFRTWKAVREEAVDVVVGTRSALFLPFPRLGLVIVDEEHDPSYGEKGRPPLYQARDAALYYAYLRQIPVVLGSATPSLETYNHARSGKYHYVALPEKALPSLPPTLHIVDMRIELQEKLSTGVFSSVLRELLEACVQEGHQAILFRNRRGYAPMLLCSTCGHRWECPSCAITLTYHKRTHRLLCHYCGHNEVVPARCPVCGGVHLQFSGIGTERIEEQLQTFFPHIRVLRLDRDTVSGHTHERLIAAFERGEADVLLGTQMVTKGLDFPRVTLVGVLYADSLLGWADFRAEERAYQLLVQLMGRAGRQGLRSHVVIQTFKPETPLFSLLEAPYETFAEKILPLRRRYGYPPSRRLIEIRLLHRQPQALETQANLWAETLQRLQIGQVLGPVYAEIPRLRGHYQMQLLLKLPIQHPYLSVRETLQKAAQAHYSRWGSHSARVVFHVDP